MLESLGLSELEDRVYRHLLRHPGSVAQIAVGLDVSRRRVSDALTRLEQLGLVRGAPDGAGWVAIPPDVGLAALAIRRQAELEHARLEIERLGEEYRTSEIERHPQELVEVVVGEEEIARWALDVHRRPKTDVMSFDCPPYTVDMEAFDEVGAEAEQLKTTTWRAVYTPESLAIPGRYAKVRTLASLGEQARVVPSLPMKLQIVDRALAVVPMTSNSRADASIAIVHESGLLSALIALFESYWGAGTPIAQVSESQLAQPDGGRLNPAQEPNDEDLMVLTLLASGMTDASISHHLQVSMRTGRRRIARVLRLVGGRSRFQAGIEANRRGWV